MSGHPRETYMAELWTPGKADQAFFGLLREYVTSVPGSQNAALQKLKEGLEREYGISISRATMRNWLRGSQPKLQNALPVIRYLLKHKDKSPD